MLPDIGNRGGMRPAVRTGFGGLNHNLSAGDGEIYYMENLSSREYPLLAPPPAYAYAPRRNADNGIGSYKGELFWVEGTNFYYGESSQAPKGTVEDSPKQFACMGDNILIFPDKKYYNVRTGTFGSMDSRVFTTGVQIRSGTYAGVSAAANTLYVPGSEGKFSPGDAVTIVGCTVNPANDKTAVIREVSGNELRFYENTFTLYHTIRHTVGAGGLAAGTYHFEHGQFDIDEDLPEGTTLTWDGTRQINNHYGVIVWLLNDIVGTWRPVSSGTGGAALEFNEEVDVDYTEPGYVGVVRAVPTLDYICVNENRLWGCKWDTIYASALGDPFNFNVFDGLSTDSWSSQTQGSGDFTGCVSYEGYPIFFKEDAIIKVQGDQPSNFRWTQSSRFGVKHNCGGSLAVAGETLFYLSPAGVCAYNGGSPRVISDALGRDTKWYVGRAGSDGVRYFISMRTDDTKNRYRSGSFLFVYDTRYGEWYAEKLDNSSANGFAWHNDYLYVMTSTAVYVRDPNPYAGLDWYNPNVRSIAEFADSTRFYETTDTGSQDKKGPLRLQLRCSLAQGTTIKVSIMYDSDGSWHEIGTVTGETGNSAKRSYNLPLIIRRCDHYRIKLEGVGHYVIYSLTEVKYSGSNLQGGSVSRPSGT